MAVYKDKLGYYIRGKIKKDDGSYYNYKKKAIGATSARQAKDFETDFLRRYQDIEMAKTQLTFKELCDEFLRNDAGIKKVSLRTKGDALHKACAAFGDKKISLITKNYLQRYILNLEEQYSQQYVSKIFYAINNAFNYAVTQDYLQINPLSKVRRKIERDKVKKEMLFWEPEQFATFLRYVDDTLYRTLFIFLYQMGCRKGEAFALQWKDIDFTNNTVNIYKSMTNKIPGEAWAITTPKTRNSTRNISMPRSVRETLSDWRQEQSGIYGFNNECYVFGFYRPLAQSTVSRRLSDGIQAANADGHELPLIRIHDLRHSHASYLINNMSDKFTDFDVAKRLGDTVETLHSTYAHWFKQADKAIIEVMDGRQSGKEDMITRLKELKELLDSEIITPEEFSKLKAQLIG